MRSSLLSDERDTFSLLTLTEFVAVIPVPASPSGGQKGMPLSSSPDGSRRSAPSGVSLPASSPAVRTSGNILKMSIPVRELNFFDIMIVVQSGAVDGEHSGSFPDTDYMSSCKQKVDVAGKSRQLLYPGNMFLFIQYSLIEMCYRPALGNIEAEEGRELCRSFSGYRITPWPERNRRSVLIIGRKIAVHHSGYPDGSHFLQFFPVFSLVVFPQFVV